VNARYVFGIAGPADDGELRSRMADDRMEGDIAISFRREPSYFAGCRLQGDATAVMKCVDTATGRIVGLGSRSTQVAYVDGLPQRIGYLADLRGAAEVRRGTLLARGFRLLRELHEHDPVPFCTTVIYEGNAPAVASLVGARAGLPVYRDFGRVLTPAIHLDFPRLALRVDGVEFGRGVTAELPRIVEFVNRSRRRRQFAPVWRVEDFGGGRLAGLAAGDFFVARAGGRIVGTVAAWDQAALRQTHVERYSRRLALVRPAWNLAARVTPLRPLPAPGARIPFVYLAGAAVEGDDVRLFRGLLRAAYDGLHRGPWHYAIASLHERDPLAAALDDYRRIPAAGRLFVVHYPEDSAAADRMSPDVPCVEGGCL
jgi:hypothetical protein